MDHCGRVVALDLAWSLSLLAIRIYAADFGSVSGALGLEQGKKAAYLLVILLNAAGENVVIPGMHGDGVVRHGLRDRRLGLQVEPLRDHVSPNQRRQLGMLPFCRIDRLAMAERRFHVPQPAA